MLFQSLIIIAITEIQHSIEVFMNERIYSQRLFSIYVVVHRNTIVLIICFRHFVLSGKIYTNKVREIFLLFLFFFSFNHLTLLITIGEQRELDCSIFGLA